MKHASVETNWSCKKCGCTEKVKGGRNGVCAACNRAKTQAWKAENRSRYNEYMRGWKERNKEKTNEANRRSYQKHIIARRDYAKRYAELNGHRRGGKDRRYYVLNSERVIAATRQWQLNNPEKVKEQHRRRRARRKQAKGVVIASDWVKLCDYFGNVCLKCKEQKSLTQDHIVPLSKGGSHTLDNLQPLCHSCNASKNNRTIDYRPSVPDWLPVEGIRDTGPVKQEPARIGPT